MSGRELLAELEKADAACAATRSELDALLRETIDVRARAEELAGILAAAPAERKRVSEALEAAEAEAKERAEALATAEAELAAAAKRRDPDRLASAKRSRDRAQDDVIAADRRVASCRTAREEHMRLVEAVESEVPEVEAHASDLAGRLKGRPRLAPEAGRAPAAGLAGVSVWAASARAALVVARSGVAAEQDSVVRQANELASTLLGEAQAATSVAVVARRVERALGP